MFTQKPVITGLGVVSPLGSDLEQIVSKLANGQTGVKPHETMSNVHVAPVAEYDKLKHVSRKLLRRMETINHFSLNAVGDALAMAGLDEQQRSETGILVGTGFAGLESVVKHKEDLLDVGIKKLRPVNFPTTVYNATAGLLSIQYGLHNVNTTLTGMNMPSEFALLYACVLIEKGQAERVVVLGADACTDPLLYGLDKLNVLANGDQAPVAFGQNSNGIAMGEGATAIVVESSQSALARNATPIAEIEAIEQYHGADSLYDYSDSSAGMEKVLQRMMARSSSTLNDFDLISLSANGASKLDALEQNALTNTKDSTTQADATANNASPLQCAYTTLSDYIGSFPGAGIMRLVMATAAMQQKSAIAPLQDKQQVEPSMFQQLSNSAGQNQRLLHVANGIGGGSIAISINVK